MARPLPPPLLVAMPQKKNIFAAEHVSSKVKLTDRVDVNKCLKEIKLQPQLAPLVSRYHLSYMTIKLYWLKKILFRTLCVLMFNSSFF